MFARRQRRVGEGEGGVGDDAGDVVDEGDQVGLAAAPAVGDVGVVHDVAHPQFAGMAVGARARYVSVSVKPSRMKCRWVSVSPFAIY